MFSACGRFNPLNFVLLIYCYILSSFLRFNKTSLLMTSAQFYALTDFPNGNMRFLFQAALQEPLSIALAMLLQQRNFGPSLRAKFLIRK